jgi:hypothetical protein
MRDHSGKLFILGFFIFFPHLLSYRGRNIPKGCSGVQLKVRVILELADTLRIQNFEKAATDYTDYTKGFIFTRTLANATRRHMRGDMMVRVIRAIRGFFNSLTRTSNCTRCSARSIRERCSILLSAQ